MNITEQNRTGHGSPVFLSDFLLWATPYVVPSVLEPCLYQQCGYHLRGYFFDFFEFFPFYVCSTWRFCSAAFVYVVPAKAKAAFWVSTDAEVRKHREQTGLDRSGRALNETRSKVSPLIARSECASSYFGETLMWMYHLTSDNPEGSALISDQEHPVETMEIGK